MSRGWMTERASAARAAVRIALLAGAAAAGASPAAAQLIQVRTVPVATGDQFLLVPSSTFGMAGARYAVDDSLADAWSNPAKGVLIGESSLFSSPAAYAISRGGGHGLTLPVSGLARGERWFGGALAAIQEVNNDLDGGDPWVWPGWGIWDGNPPNLSEVSSRNLYAAGFLGRRLGDSPWSLGVGVSTSSLQAMDGVDLLYGGAQRIDQSGSVRDFRVGLYRDGDGDRDRFSWTVARNLIDMEHEVTYVDVHWPPESTEIPSEPVLIPRTEINLDRTNAWGMQLAWDRRLAAPGWRMGASLIGNRKSHPKIPNYNIQNIPRDPGHSNAFELGFGVGRSVGASAFAVDVALQPIESETWQEAETEEVKDGGGVIPVGGKTIENYFSFLNAQVRVGASHQFDGLRLQGGIEGRSYSYSLEQTNKITGTTRDQDESWMEWTPAFSALFSLDGLDIQYGLRFTTGTGHPGTDVSGGEDFAASPTAPGGDFVTAPEGPLTLRDATVVTHQVWVRIPIR